MPPSIRMPSETELPAGPVREFVAILFDLYREAHRPTLRQISSVIRRLDLPGTASTETIRKMLRGTTVPRWPTVEVVLLALCEIAETHPDQEFPDQAAWNTSSRQQVVANLWDRAQDEPDVRYPEDLEPRRGLADEPPS